MERNKDFDRRVGRVVKLLGKASGIPMTRLARDFEMSYAALNARLAGETQFLAVEVDALADYFEVDPGVFFRPALELVSSTLSGGEPPSTRRPSAPSARCATSSQVNPTIRSRRRHRRSRRAFLPSCAHLYAH